MLLVRAVGPGVVPYFLDGRDHGSWTASARRLLDLPGPVTGEALRRVLNGHDPATGVPLQTVRRRGRRAGWDLIFAAPKSVSLLAATADDPNVVGDAHAAAVTDVLDHVETRLAVWDSSAPDKRAPAGGLIGARFEHRLNAASEPHVHTHVLVANLTRTGRGWTAVRGDPWYVGRESLGALYQMALRYQLRCRGLDLEWRMRPDGLADVAGVPTATVRAASTQARLVGAMGPFAARRQAEPQAWRDRAERTGFEPDAVSYSSPQPSRPPVDPPRGGVGDALTDRVITRLAMRRSDFRQDDAIVALSASLPGGCPPAEAMAWVERFCAASREVPSPTAGKRWTTALARSADDRLDALLEQRFGAGDGGRRPVTVLASPPGRSEILAQAEYLGRLRSQWDEEGLRSAVAAPDGLAAARWEVLTGLAPYRPGSRVDVLVVDRADRRSTAELLALLERVGIGSGGIVFVEGGTLPRLTNFASHGLADFADRRGRFGCPPVTPWAPRFSSAGGMAAERGRQAVGDLLARWAGTGGRELLVGLGLEEVRGLNRAARELEAGGRQPAVELAGFATGDRVVVLRAGEHRPPYATFGRICGIADRGREVSIRWDGESRPSAYGPEVLAGLGPGWASTPRLASRAGRPVMLLGPVEAAPRIRGLVRESIERQPGGPERHLGLGR